MKEPFRKREADLLKNRFRRARSAVAFLAAILIAAPAAHAQEMQFDQSALVQSLLPMVVNITAVVAASIPAPQSAGAMGDPGLAASPEKRQLGSGFIIDPSGVIVTNYHVVDGAYELIVTFSDGTQTTANVLEADRLSDIALLKVSTRAKLPTAKWADSRSVHIGDPVLAIGNPLGVGLSVTGGIVSALHRNIMETPYDDYIQTDAPINHGNSGGPLFNLHGQVVGINTAIISPTAGSAGIGFAIPANDARFVIGQLQKYGWLHPGWLGIKVQQITPDMAQALGMGEPQGSIVAEVMTDSPAAKAGLEVGDIVLDYNNRMPPNERELLADIAITEPGTTVPITVLRGATKLRVPATIAEWPRRQWETFDAPVQQARPVPMIPPDLGIKVAALPATQRVMLHLDAASPAVLVTSVQPGTDAAQRGVKAGDAILRVQSQVTASAAAFYAAIADARQQHRDFIVVLLLPQKQVTPGPEWIALQIANSGA